MKCISKNILLGVSCMIVMSSCAIVKPGEVGVKRKLGKLSDRVLDQGAYFLNPFTTKVLKTPVRNVNLEIKLSLPSKEGLNISSEISIIYNIEKTKVPLLIEEIGLDYERIITSVFRSSSADVCSNFMAKDMHSGKRSEIENAIKARMSELLIEKGIIIDAVLLKSIKLPPGLYNSIETKLEAEQDALRMKFILEQEKLEAERMIIKAKGERDAQKIIAEGLSDKILELRKIEAFLKLSESPNSKVIVTDGKSPLLIE